MARSVNQVNVMGRLTRDPELKATTTGKMIAQFSVAVDRQGSEDTDFFDVVAWNKLAELVDQYTQKGSKVYISGRLQLDRWESDGEKRSKISIIANDIVFLDSRSEGADANPRENRPLTQAEVLAAANGPKPEEKPIDLSEIPF